MNIPKYIEIKSAAGQRAAFLSPKADGLKDCHVDCRLNGESTLEFMLPANSPKLAELPPECQIWTGGRVYTLLKDDAIDFVRDENNKLWAKFSAIERWAELDTMFIEPYISNDPGIPVPADLAVIIVGGGSDLSGGRYAVGSAGHALYVALNGSGWSLGTVDVPGIHDIEMEKESRLGLVKMIQETWGGYLVWDSENKTVSLRDPNTWQNYTGFQIRYKKNLKHITRTQSNRLVTKLYCFGHDDLDIASVNGGKKYITDFSYTTREYVGIYRNPDIENVQELKEKGAAELSLISRPRYLYRVKMVDLRTLPEYSHENFTLGDMADVIDPDIAPDSPRPRIIRHKYNLFQPWMCEVEIGDPEERLVEQLKASFDTTGFIDGKFNSEGRMSGYHIIDGTLSAKKIVTGELIVGTNVDIGTAQDATGVTTIIGNTVTTGFVNALNVKAGSVDAENITGTYITGKALRTAASGKRIEISLSSYSGYINFTDNSGSDRAWIYLNDSNNMHISNGGDVYLSAASGNINIQTLTSGNIQIGAPGGNVCYFWGTWNCNGAAFTELSDGSSFYRTESWINSQGFATQSWANGRFVRDYVGQGIEIQYFDDHLEVRTSGGSWKTVSFV